MESDKKFTVESDEACTMKSDFVRKLRFLFFLYFSFFLRLYEYHYPAAVGAVFDISVSTFELWN